MIKMRARGRRIPRVFDIVLLFLLAAASPLRGGDLEIRGRVLGAGEEPLTSARVELLPALDPHQGGRLLLEGILTPEAVAGSRVGRDGRYSVSVPDVEVWRIAITAPGHLGMTYGPVPLAEPLDLPEVELRPATTVEVMVRAAEGKSLAGAQVRASMVEARDFWREEIEAGWLPEPRYALTDARGRVSFSRAEGEVLDLRAYTPEHRESPPHRAGAGLVVIDLEAASPRTLMLLDAEQRPLAGAIVRAGMWRWLVGESDATGSFSGVLGAGEAEQMFVSLAETGSFRLPAPPPAVVDRPGSEVRTVLQLPAARRISGTVVDVTTGAPIPGAMVYSQKALPRHVFSGPRGDFSLPVHPAQKTYLAVMSPGYFGSSDILDLAELEEAKPLRFRLSPALTLLGRVVSEGGDPVEGARIRLLRVRPGDDDEETWSGAVSTSSSRGGRFSFRQLHKGAFLALRVDHPRYLELEERHLLSGVGPGIEEDLELVLRRRGVLTAEIVDPAGDPVAGAEVKLHEISPEGKLSIRYEAEKQAADFGGLSDREGRVELLVPRGARFALAVLADGFARYAVSRLELDPGVERSDLGVIELEPEARFEGRVIDPAGEPVMGAEIRRRDPYGRSSPAWAGELSVRGRKGPDAVSDDDGLFSLSSVRGGERLGLAVKKAGFVPWSAHRIEAPTEEPFEVRLVPGGRIFGAVTDSEGAAIEGAWVRLARKRISTGSANVDWPRAGGRRSGADGEFALDDLAAGLYRLTVYGRELAPRVVPDLELEEGGEVGPIRVVLERGGRITGTVVDEGGSAVDGAYIEISPGATTPDRPEHRSPVSSGTRSDAAGAFDLGVFPTGPASISASAVSGSLVERHVIQSGKNELILRLEFKPSVSGRVLDEADQPIEGSYVSLETKVDSTWTGNRVNAGPDGGFSFGPVEPGEYTLRASAPGWAPSSTDLPVTVGSQAVEGLVLRLSKGAAIHGRIGGLEPFDLERVQVSARHREGGLGATGTADHEGRYRLEGITPGTWLVWAVFRDTGRTAEGETTLRKGESEAIVDLEFRTGLTVSGSLEINGEPGGGYSVRLLRPDAGVHATIDFLGRFRLEGVEPGRYDLSVGKGLGALIHHRVLEVEGDVEVDLDLDFPTLVGSVRRRSDGSPVAGASIDLSSLLAGDLRLLASHNLESDGNGEFVLVEIAPGTYRLKAWKKGVGATSIDVEIGAQSSARFELWLDEEGEPALE